MLDSSSTMRMLCIELCGVCFSLGALGFGGDRQLNYKARSHRRVFFNPHRTAMRLDDTSAKSKLRRMELRKFRLLASSYRLRAEIASSDKLELPAALLREASDPTMQAIVETQKADRTQSHSQPRLHTFLARYE